uniref:BTB domain-containing protein n=1 Tax=Stomoxys calcitrans TaxID=35570 RepID=A0A1I8NQN5_STOCA
MAGSIMDSKSPLHQQQETANTTATASASPSSSSNQPAISQDSVAAYRGLLEASAKARGAKQHSPPQGSAALLQSLALSPHRPSSREQKKASAIDDDQEHNSPAYVSELNEPQSHMRSAEDQAPAYSPHSERSSTGSTSVQGAQQFCLRWNNYQSNLTSVFDQLLQNEAFVDVTLACDGRSIKAHKMVLSACSPYFQTLFSTTPCQHPIVIMRDVNWRELKAIVDFMYKGEINVCQDQIGPLLRIAEMLKVRGLADVGNIASSSETAQLSNKTEPSTSPDKEYYSPSRAPEASSPKMRKKSLSPYSKRRSSEPQEQTDMDLLTQQETEKSRLRMEVPTWDLNLPASTSRSGLELRLSPLHQQTHTPLVGRNVRKRRWPSADTIFNPPESPLGSLIAAERAEQERNRERERERERDRERERVRDRDGSLFTPPMPVISGASSNILEPSTHLDFPSPSPTPTPNILPSGSRTPATLLTSVSPHLQISQQHHHHHLQQQQQQQQQQQSQTHHSSQHSQHSSAHGGAGGSGGGSGSAGQHHISGLQSHRSSPASSVTSTHPSSILSRPLTPSPASVTGSGGVGGSGGGVGVGVGSRLGDSDRFSLGPAQAAAMLGAAAASQMELSASAASMGMRSLPSSGQTMGQGPSHHSSSIADDLEIKPGIAEMIREEER